jgi:signal transduction histidine kinase/ActR/RegA family two-component response regulator
MRFITDVSIQKKLIRVIMLTSGIALALACVLFAIYNFTMFRIGEVRELTSLAEIVGNNSSAALVFDDSQTAKDVLSSLKMDDRIEGAAVYDKNGKIFASFNRNHSEANVFLSKPNSSINSFTLQKLDIELPIQLNEETIGTIRIISHQKSLIKLLGENGLIVFLVLIISSIVAYLVSKKLESMISSPILHLSDKVSQVSINRDYSIRAKKTTQDEMGNLIDRFNEMLDRIQEQEIALQGANDRLEDQVEERTAKLKAAISEAERAKIESEKANQAKSEFLSRMSHELRTPMNAILGFTQMMLKDTQNPLNEIHQTDANHIIKAGNHLLELINEILDLSRIESGQFSVSNQNNHLGNIMEEVLEIIDPTAKKHKIQLACNMDQFKNTHVFADSVRLKQVILNLLSNGIKYNNPKGSVQVIQEISKDNHAVKLKFVDTGPGIPADKLKDIFEPFNRLEADKTAIEGTGIGLSICEKLMEMMGGNLKVESTVGVGSEFSIEMPIGQPVKNKAQVKPSTQNPELNNLKSTNADSILALYIEDNPENLALVQRIVSEIPAIKLISAPRAKPGIELAKTHQPNIVLMDINMPEMDGFQALKQLQSLEETNEIPVIAVSANAMEKDIEKAKQAGFNDYITKPIEIQSFISVISKTLGKQVKME